jgi:ribosomal protein L4
LGSARTGRQGHLGAMRSRAATFRRPLWIGGGRLP